MTDEQYRIEKIKDYRRDILRLHSLWEIRMRFTLRSGEVRWFVKPDGTPALMESMDETFSAMGNLIDPQNEKPVFLGYEYLKDSKMLDLKYAYLFD